MLTTATPPSVEAPLRNTDPVRRPPNHAVDGRPDPDNPLGHLTPEQVADLTNGLLEDWDRPTMTELGLCRAHQITLDQLHALATRPAFRHALERIRTIRAMRQPDRDAAARALAMDRLISIAQQTPASASHAKEIRLAIKQLLALLDAREEAAPAPTGPAPTDAAPEPDPEPQPRDPASGGPPPEPHGYWEPRAATSPPEPARVGPEALEEPRRLNPPTS